MMGLGFPGGAKIAKLSEAFDARASESEKNQVKNLFPRSYLEKDSFDFSFSGMKSAVKRYIDSLEKLTQDDMERIAYASEQAIVGILSDKIVAAAEKHNISFLCLAGGVSANTRLRDMMREKAKER